MKRHALIACLFLPLSCVWSHAPTAARVVIPPAVSVGTEDIQAPRVGSKATAAWEMLSSKRSCMCDPLEGDDDREMFLRAPSPEPAGLLVFRPGSARPTGIAGRATRDGRLTGVELALYSNEVMPRRLGDRAVDTIGLVNRPDFRRQSREDAVRKIFADATAREELERRLLDLQATASHSPPERDGKLAAELLPEGGRR